MKRINEYPPFGPFLADANHCDVKTAAVAALPAELCLREAIAGLINYSPAWLKALYGVRMGLARLLGLASAGVPAPARLSGDSVPMRPGEKAGFFTVVAAEEGRHWLASAADTHLTAHLGVVLEAGATGNRLHVATIVHYHRWTGPVYFNIIRPFHHLVVGSMLKASQAHLAGVQGRSASYGNA